MSDGPVVREYRASDANDVEACIAELQDYERGIDPRLRPGSVMAAEYRAQMLVRCQDYTGCIFVAERASVVAGFVAVLARLPFIELDDPPGEYALITDLFVLERFRRHGYGRALLDAAERFAREQGATELRIGVLSANRTAKELYARAGFAGHAEILAKRFD